MIDQIEDVFDPKKALEKALNRAADVYNGLYVQVNEAGERLFKEREASVTVIESIEGFINTISKYPKAFDKEIHEITVCKNNFTDAKAFGIKNSDAIKISSVSAGAGIATGAAITSLGPTAAMWIATTFGTASTGTAISALSGAAATNAALAWLGGGAISAGGAGIAGGSALLAMAGPIGIAVAGVSIVGSAALLNRNIKKIDQAKKDQIKKLQAASASLKRLKSQIDVLTEQTVSLKSNLESQYLELQSLAGKDYQTFSDNEKSLLGALVNNTNSLAVLLSTIVEENETV